MAMKKYIYFITILSCVVLLPTSCEDENDFSDHVEFIPILFRPDSSYYTCIKYVPELGHSVRIKGNAYINIHDVGYGFAMYNYTDTLNWGENEFWAGLNEHMGASSCKLQLGKISLIGKGVEFEDCTEGSCFLSKWNQDIPLALYDEDPSKESWLEITRIDSIQKIVEGKFQFHFVFAREDDNSAPDFAQRISYLDGQFKAKANF